MTIRKHLQCDNPDCPHERQLKFSSWIRDNLPDSHEFLVTDWDFILYNKQNNTFLILEKKTRNAVIKSWQQKLFHRINFYIKQGVATDSYKEDRYLGSHNIIFENYSFRDSRGVCLFNNKLSITGTQAIEIFSMNNERINDCLESITFGRFQEKTKAWNKLKILIKDY